MARVKGPDAVLMYKHILISRRSVRRIYIQNLALMGDEKWELNGNNLRFSAVRTRIKYFLTLEINLNSILLVSPIIYNLDSIILVGDLSELIQNFSFGSPFTVPRLNWTSTWNEELNAQVSLSNNMTRAVFLITVVFSSSTTTAFMWMFYHRLGLQNRYLW